MFTIIFVPALAIGCLGLLYGLALAFASKLFMVHIDERITQIVDLLPGANCGGCGYAGCAGYANGIINNNADYTLCGPGGQEIINQIANIIGKKIIKIEKQVALIHCGSGGLNNTNRKYEYYGVDSCRAVVLLSSGPNICTNGCVSQNDCLKACNYNAITLSSENMRLINPDLCTGCGACVKNCPRQLFELVPLSKKVHILCSSTKRGLEAKKQCGAVACVGCGICAKNCPVEAIVVENHLAKINYTVCINCGICAKKCPTGVIRDLCEKRGKAFINHDACIGCTLCSKKCPVKCISGKLKEKHDINTNDCIGCELCVSICPKQAIYIEY